jgi:hypothetical protein
MYFVYANPPITEGLKKSVSLFLLFFSKIILYLIGLTVVITGLIFMAGGHLYNNGIILFSVVVILISLVTWEFKKFYSVTTHELTVNIAVSFLIIFLLTLVMSKIYDKSWDGMTYHQKAVIELNEGWNPFYESLPYEKQHSKYYDRKIVLNLWVNHYSKGAETFAAILMGLTKNVESGKVFNILLLLTSFCCVFFSLINLKKWNTAWISVLSLVAAFNPIAINQLLSYYVDGAVGSLLLIVISQFISLAFSNQRNKDTSIFLSLFFASVILINLKFTGLVYLIWLCLCFACLILHLRQFQLLKRFLYVSLATGIIAVIIGGFNPYVTNTVNFGHPFYPIAGKSKVDISAHNIPPELKEYNAVGKFFVSNFSKSNNADINRTYPIELKVPLTFSRQEIRAFQSEGVRLGGMGVLWSGILCLSVLGACVAAAKLSRKNFLYLFFTSSAIFISALMNPMSWWARFVPQLWLLPVIIFFFSIFVYKRRTLQWIAKTGLVLMLINSMLIAAVYVHSVLITTKRANELFDRLQKSTIPTYVYFDIFPSNQKKLEAKNIPYIQVDHIENLPCARKTQVLKIDLCEPADVSDKLLQRVRSKSEP